MPPITYPVERSASRAGAMAARFAPAAAASRFRSSCDATGRIATTRRASSSFATSVLKTRSAGRPNASDARAPKPRPDPPSNSWTENSIPAASARAMAGVTSTESLARREPAGARGAELERRALLVLLALGRRQRVLPAPVDALVDEDLRASVPERAAERHALRGVLLHPVERAVLDDVLPARLANRDLEEFRDAPQLPGHVALQVREVDEHHVRQLADLPPAADVLPERPEGMAVAVHPIAPVLLHVVR